MKDRSDDPSHHERTLLPRSYISLLYGVIQFNITLKQYETVRVPDFEERLDPGEEALILDVDVGVQRLLGPQLAPLVVLSVKQRRPPAIDALTQSLVRIWSTLC